MATTTMDSTNRRSNTGIYWSVAIAVLVILAFTFAMRSRDRNLTDTSGMSTSSPQNMTTSTGDVTMDTTGTLSNKGTTGTNGTTTNSGSTNSNSTPPTTTND